MKKINYMIFVVLLILGSSVSAQRVLSLEESKQLALKNNTEVKNSRLEVEASKQIRKSAITGYFPNISAGGMIFEAEKGLMEMESHGGDLPVYDGDPANISSATTFAYMPSATMGLMKKGKVGFINVIQPVFAGGRIWNGNKLAGLGEDASVYQNNLTTNEILLKTEQQYWQIVSLEEKDKTIIKYENLLRKLLNKVEDAYSSGLVMKNDVLKVKVKLNEILLNKSKLENGIQLAKMAFCQHIGIENDPKLQLKDKLMIGEMPEAYFIENEEALKNRNEYKLLQLSVDAENLKTKMKLGEYLPQVGVGLSGMYMKFDEGKDRTLGMVFATASVPISDWWGGYHELEERSIQEKIAENNFKNNSQLLILQMEKAWQDFNDAYKEYLLSEESVEQAKENLDVNQDSYDNGLIDLSDLLEAQAMLQQAEDQLTEAKSGYLTKKTEYLQVTGR